MAIMDTPDRPSAQVDNSTLEIDDNSWMIGQVVISRRTSKPAGPFWDDGEGTFFTITEAPSLKLPTRPISDDCPVKNHLGWEAPCKYGIWEIGRAYLSIQQDGGTPEHVTLETLANRPLSFQVPTVYYHGVHGGLYYIVYSALPGKTIFEAWPEASEDAMKIRILDQIANACIELSAWRSESITGIEGGVLRERWLSKHEGYPGPYAPEALRQSCEEIGLDCSNLVFQHNHLTPLAFTVDESGGLLGIYQWMDAGFLPKDWLATKATFNSCHDAWQRCKASWSEKQVSEWDNGIVNALKAHGFREFFMPHHDWRIEMLRNRSQIG